MNDLEPGSLPPTPESRIAGVRAPSASILSAGFPSPVATLPVWSGLGVSAIALSVLGGGGLFVAIGYMAYRQLQTSGDVTANSGLMMVVGLAMIFCAMLMLLGIVLGFAGLFQTGRKKLLPVLGIVFNAILLGFLALLYAIGLASP